ncbi:MAG: DUF3368 domain-containing protein [Candidatus Nanohaloarchaea archaeon]
MNKAVADATVLIYLAKLDRLEVLLDEFERILVPEKVEEEVIDGGRKAGREDYLKIDSFMENDEVELNEAEIPEKAERLGMEPGERSVLSLALNMDVNVVLVDESSVREAAKSLDLEPRGTLYLLLKLVRRGEIDFEGFLDIMDRLTESGFYLDERVYSKAVREASKLDSTT